jgi:hypothetical protein
MQSGLISEGRRLPAYHAQGRLAGPRAPGHLLGHSNPASRALRSAYERCRAQAREASRVARRRPFADAAARQGPPLR